MGEKRQQVQSFAGETVLRGEEFKRYVNSLRGKSNAYKKKRAEMSDLRAEYGVLTRTMDILVAKNERLQQSLSKLESERGITGFRDTQSNLAAIDATASNLDEQKGRVQGFLMEALVLMSHFRSDLGRHVSVSSTIDDENRRT